MENSEWGVRGRMILYTKCAVCSKRLKIYSPVVIKEYFCSDCEIYEEVRKTELFKVLERQESDEKE